MASISLPTAVAISAGAGLVGSGVSALAASGAAGAQAGAANRASQQQLEMFNTIENQLTPYMSAGQSAIPMVEGLLGLSPGAGGGGAPGAPGVDVGATGKTLQGLLQKYNLTGTPFGQKVSSALQAGNWSGVQQATNLWAATTTNPSNAAMRNAIVQAVSNPTMVAPSASTPGALPGSASTIENFLTQTPGYQFTLDQGLQSVQSGFAAKGLADSGSALKGAAQYATGLAQNTYQQQLSNYMNLLGTGLSAANMGGQFGTQATSLANQYSTSAAAAQAAGAVGVANALSGGFNNASSLALLAGLNPGGLFSSTNGGINQVAVTPNQLTGGY